MVGSLSASRARSLAFAMYVPGLVLQLLRRVWLLLKLVYCRYHHVTEFRRNVFECLGDGVVC